MPQLPCQGESETEGGREGDIDREIERDRESERVREGKGRVTQQPQILRQKKPIKNALLKAV